MANSYNSLTLDVDNNGNIDDISNISLPVTSYLTLNEVSNFLQMPNYSNTYHLLHANCRSLPKNFDALCSTIDCIDVPFTAIAVTETWLKQHNDNIFAIPGYVFESSSRLLKAGGGVGLYICDQLKYRHIPDLTFVTETLECIFVEILVENRKNLIIGCIYRPPNSDINMFNEKLQNILEHNCFQKNKKIFIMGDFNINLLQLETHSPTDSFLNIMISHGLLPSITKASRVTDETTSLIDNIFTNVDTSHCKSALLYSDISDHYPVLLQCRTKIISFAKTCCSNN